MYSGLGILFQMLIHLQCWGFLTRTTHYFCRHPCHSDMGRHIVKHQTSSTYFDPIPDRDITENFRARTDHDAIAYMGMATATFTAAATQRYRVENRDVIANNSGFANNQTRGMVDHNARAHLRPWMNIHSKGFRNLVLKK